MKIRHKISFASLGALVIFGAVLVAQDEGPKKDVGETVAKPRKNHNLTPGYLLGAPA